METRNYKIISGITLICIIFIIFFVTQVSAFSVMELLGLEKPESENVESKPAQANTSKQNGDSKQSKSETVDANEVPQLNLDFMSFLIKNMSPNDREQVLSDTEIFKQLVENEANNRSIISAAVANKLNQDRNVKFLMRRAAENTLRESYLKFLTTNKLPADFPNSEQVAEFYEKNKQQFVVPERVHIWQIFYNKLPESNEKEIKELRNKAASAYTKIKSGKAEFAVIAIAESDHQQSKATGGYAGLTKVNDLLPEIKETILNLKENELSKPFETDSGIHIFKRGKILKEETLELSQVQEQIKNILINQASNQIRNAIITQARKEFPQDISENKMEEWRIRLRTNLN